MNAQHAAQSAYRSAGENIRSPRRTEYDAIARLTHQLKHAARQGPTGFPALAEALHMNCKLWTLLASEVADQSNELPAELRSRIFYLSEFTMHHSRKVLAGKASVRPLLEVNTAVLKGLRSMGGSQ